ncbi:MAG: hypothetical protein C4558_09345 [Dehalococcoidia bacterium]|nr:MAG: hypothetical protein C4558_09345 [Dehalococcoidia bacterium]
MHKKLLITALAALFAVVGAFAGGGALERRAEAALCPGVVVNPENGHGYQAVAVPGGITWPAAKAAAEALSCAGEAGHLVTITSANEQNFIGTNFPAAYGTASDFGYWIGGKRSGAGFVWVTGEPFGAYTNWNPGEPSGDADGALHFFGLGTNGRWNDAEATIWHFPGYVVEFPLDAPLDSDGDGVPDATDNCTGVANADQTNTDGDALGNTCDPDDDGDGVADPGDNCALVVNAEQANLDGDALGDACDPDDDGDGVSDGADQCAGTPAGVAVNANGCSAAQLDGDGDGVSDANDNCAVTPNADQVDSDGDGIGDACDETPLPLPTSQAYCMKGGWQQYGVFKTQGDCVSFVATKGKNPPAG